MLYILSIFLGSPFTAVILPNFYCDLTRIFLDYFWQILVGFLLQNHVCSQFPAQGPPEDRGREERTTSQNHGLHSHC
jgi:hypothetical protein